MGIPFQYQAVRPVETQKKNKKAVSKQYNIVVKIDTHLKSKFVLGCAQNHSYNYSNLAKNYFVTPPLASSHCP